VNNGDAEGVGIGDAEGVKVKKMDTVSDGDAEELLLVVLVVLLILQPVPKV